MNWLIRYSLLLSVLHVELSFQSGCPYAQKQQNEYSVLSAESIASLIGGNVLSKSDMRKHPNTEYNVVKAVEESSLSAKAIESLLQSSYSSNAIRKESIAGDKTFNSLYNSYMGATKTSELECAVPPTSCANETSNYYYRTYDGSCNNFAKPGFGMANTRYARILAPKYGDGVYAPSRSTTGKALPNARLLSLALYGEDTLSDRYRTLMTMQFSQFVSHDISLFASDNIPDCCSNPGHKLCYSIPLHPYGPIAMTTGKTCLSFTRSLSDADISCRPSGLPYAEKITVTSAFLDLSSVYGNSLEQNIKVRQYNGGLLKTSSFKGKSFLPKTTNVNEECPENMEQCYNIADERNQFTPTIAVLHTVFVREHNRLANILAQLNPQHSDEKIFQLARKINIAQFQKITYYDFLPLLLGPEYTFANRLIHQTSPHEYVNDYDERWNPAPLASYAAAAFRYMHHSIPGWFSMISSGRSSNQTMRLSDYFERQETLQLLEEADNFNSLIRGLTTQLEKRTDGSVDREIKHHFNRKPFDEFGADLKAIDIQRGRDYGLPSYNDFREQCGLMRAYRWSDFANEISPEKINLLKKFYSSPNDVDLSLGGSFESHAAESIFGPTFQCIIGKQFLRTRIADRFFFEHEDRNSGFTRDQLANIRKVSLAGILCANGDNLQTIQPNVFVFPNQQNCLAYCKNIPQLNLRLWKDHY